MDKMTLAEKIAEQRRAKAEQLFTDAKAHHEADPYSVHVYELIARGFVQLRAARQADTGDTSPMEG